MIDPNSLTAADLATLLTRATGGKWPVSAEQIAADVAAGAPTNADGTLRLVTYCAWLIRARP